MTWLRTQISILLIAVLVLTGHSMAIARGMPTSSGFMELCTSIGPVMTPVVADGHPTGHTHICPEFSLSLMYAVAHVPVLAAPVETRGQRVEEAHEASFRLIRAVEALARAPPLVS